MHSVLFAVAALATALSPSADASAGHTEQLEHRGVGYEVTYQPQVRTMEKTIGVHPGARSTPQRCRAVTEIAVDRAVRQAGGDAALSQRLAGAHRITTYLVGPCEHNRQALAAARARQAPAIAAQVRTMAAGDRRALLAQIDAARTLATN